MTHRHILVSLLAALLAVPAIALASDNPVRIEAGWARATPPGARSGGGYLTIENTGAASDRLLSVDSPAAETTEIHEMTTKDGVMTMRAVPEGVEIPASGSLVLAPGGYHLMFIRPKEPFMAGGQVPVTLHFEKAGAIPTELAVQPIGARGPASGDGHGAHGMKMEGAAP